MARTAKVLSAAEVRMLSQSAGEYTVGGVSGLRLLVREKPGEKGAFYRSWVLRKQGAKGFKIGLGVYPTIGLKEAAGASFRGARERLRVKSILYLDRLNSQDHFQVGHRVRCHSERAVCGVRIEGFVLQLNPPGALAPDGAGRNGG